MQIDLFLLTVIFRFQLFVLKCLVEKSNSLLVNVSLVYIVKNSMLKIIFTESF